MANIKISELTEKTSPHKDDLLVIADMENDLSKSLKYGTIKPYKVYTALLTQLGTNAPVATVLENTIGAIVWTRNGAGDYRATLTGAFTENKTYSPQDLTVSVDNSNDRDYWLRAYRETNNVFIVYTIVNNINVDEYLSVKLIEIRVYN